MASAAAPAPAHSTTTSTTISMARPPPPLSEHPFLPPGFRFHPTDEELVVHYLGKKAASLPLPVPIIADINLYKFDPWDLPEMANFGETEWYFFSPRDRKYPNGARPNRAAASGYWKATGTDKPITSAGGSLKIGVKKALVFYKGKPPKGIKTNWIMHEYRLASAHSNPAASFQSKKSLRLDDWVLCRIYKKNNNSVPESRFSESKLCECANPTSVEHGGFFSAFNNSDADDPFLDNIFLEPEFVSNHFSQINSLNGGIKGLQQDGIQVQSMAMPKSELDVYAKAEDRDSGHGEYGFAFAKSSIDFPDMTQKHSQQPAMRLQLNVTGPEKCCKWPM